MPSVRDLARSQAEIEAAPPAAALEGALADAKEMDRQHRLREAKRIRELLEEKI
jgi:hypothetical protein